VLGKVGVGISGVLLGLSILIFAFVLTIWLDTEKAGWFKGTPFGVIITGIVLVLSLALFGLFRAKWLK
jgi:hypothetical protein